MMVPVKQVAYYLKLAGVYWRAYTLISIDEEMKLQRDHNFGLGENGVVLLLGIFSLITLANKREGRQII
jgi:hypothetical protein